MYRLRSEAREVGNLTEARDRESLQQSSFGFSLRHAKGDGFGGKLIKWIFYYIYTVKLSINIYGSPKGIVATKKGLRQGDPLFPFLFTGRLKQDACHSRTTYVD